MDEIGVVLDVLRAIWDWLLGVQFAGVPVALILLSLLALELVLEWFLELTGGTD